MNTKRSKNFAQPISWGIVEVDGPNDEKPLIPKFAKWGSRDTVIYFIKQGWHYTIADAGQLTEQRWEAAFACRKAHPSNAPLVPALRAEFGNESLSLPAVLPALAYQLSSRSASNVLKFRAKA